MKKLAFRAPKFSSWSKEPSPASAPPSRPIIIGFPHEDSVSTDTSLTPNPAFMDPEERYTCARFKKEMNASGAHAIPDRNPVKQTRSRNGSPNSSDVLGEAKGLPFQRRARSNSPHSGPIVFGSTRNFSLFPSNSPIRATKQVQGKKPTENSELKRVSLYRYEATMEIDSSSDSSDSSDYD